MTHLRTIIFASSIPCLMAVACGDEGEPVQKKTTTYWGYAGVNTVIWPTIKLGEAGQGGAAGEGGASEGGQAGQAGSPEGGQAGSSELAGAGGEPEDCQLPEYLQLGHQVPLGQGRPAVEDSVVPTGTVPFGTIVRYSKYSNWRCDHQPFCDYEVQAPSDEGFPETRRYWEPVRWQGQPPDGVVGSWIGMCTLPQWKPHGTCGGFYRDGDYVDYKDPTDLYAERFVWQCRAGWAAGCDTQPPGTGMAWVNASTTLHCYGY